MSADGDMQAKYTCVFIKQFKDGTVDFYGSFLNNKLRLLDESFEEFTSGGLAEYAPFSWLEPQPHLRSAKRSTSGRQLTDDSDAGVKLAYKNMSTTTKRTV